MSLQHRLVACPWLPWPQSAMTPVQPQVWPEVMMPGCPPAAAALELATDSGTEIASGQLLHLWRTRTAASECVATNYTNTRLALLVQVRRSQWHLLGAFTHRGPLHFVDMGRCH